MQETNIEARWPELFTPLTRAERDEVLDGCWQLVRQGRPLTRASVVELVRGVRQGNAPRRAGGVMGRIARAA